MKIINRKISELIPADYNPRLLTEKEYYDLKESLEKFGFVDPIIINTHPDRKNVIIGGHQRVKVWQDLGHKEAPTVEVDLPIDQEKELNVRLNKNTGRWDFDMLANLFDPEDLSAWGFTAEDIGVALEDLEVARKRRNRWLKLCYDEDTYDQIMLKLLESGETPEKALINLLKLS